MDEKIPVQNVFCNLVIFRLKWWKWQNSEFLVEEKFRSESILNGLKRILKQNLEIENDFPTPNCSGSLSFLAKIVKMPKLHF